MLLFDFDEIFYMQLYPVIRTYRGLGVLGLDSLDRTLLLFPFALRVLEVSRDFAPVFVLRIEKKAKNKNN